MTHKYGDIEGIVSALMDTETSLADGGASRFEAGGDDLESVAAAVTAAKLGVPVEIAAPPPADPTQAVNRRIIRLLADAPRPPTLGGA